MICYIITEGRRYGLIRWLRNGQGYRKFKRNPYWKKARVIAREKALDWSDYPPATYDDYLRRLKG